MVKLVDTPGLEPGAARLGGSSPFSRIIQVLSSALVLFFLPGCSSNAALQTQRIFQELEHSDTPNEAFKFSLGEHCYALEQQSLKRLPQLFEQECAGTKERLVLDFASLLNGRLSLVRGVRVSPSGDRIAFTGTTGKSESKLFIYERPTRKLKELPGATAPVGFEWFNDSTHLLEKTTEGGTESVLVFDTRDGSSRLLARMEGSSRYYYLERSGSGRFLLVDSRELFHHNWSFISADEPEGTLSPLFPKDVGDVSLTCDTLEERLGAREGELKVYPLKGSAERKTLPIPKESEISALRCFSSFALLAVENGSSQKVFAYDPRKERLQILKTAALWNSIPALQPFTSRNPLIVLEGPGERPTPCSIRVTNGAFSLERCEPKLEHSLVTEELTAKSFDGASVPVTIVYRKGSLLPTGSPLLIHSYGAYGVALPATYKPELLALLNRGFVYAYVNTRGGGGKGVSWQRDGSGDNKINAVKDLIAAATMLQERRIAAKGKTYAYGRSAGAAIVLTAAHEEPELFSALIIESPLLRPATLFNDPNEPHPLREEAEWGNSDKAMQFDALEHLKKREPPPIFLSFSRNDNTVPLDDILDFIKIAWSSYGQGMGLEIFETSDSSHYGADYREAQHRLEASQDEFLLKR